MFYYIDQPQTPWLDPLKLAEGDESWWKLWLMLMLMIFWFPETRPVILRVQV